jgi:hypothetical protein
MRRSTRETRKPQLYTVEAGNQRKTAKLTPSSEEEDSGNDEDFYQPKRTKRTQATKSATTTTSNVSKEKTSSGDRSTLFGTFLVRHARVSDIA